MAKHCKCSLLPRIAGSAAITFLAIANGALVVDAQTTPVTGWFTDKDELVCLECMNRHTNSPIIGDGTPNSADNTTIWAALANPITLANGQQVALTGSVQLIGVNTGGGDGMRLGLFDGNNWFAPGSNESYEGLPDEQYVSGKVPAGWRGFIATVPSHPAFGFLDAKNPNHASFHSSHFMSINAFSIYGIVPFLPGTSGVIQPGLPNTQARTIRLAAGQPVQGTVIDGTYDFALRVARFGDEQFISVRVVSQDAVPGDFDDDRDIDGRDFLIWQRGGSPAPLSLADLQAWQANYGQTPTAQPRYEWHLSATVPQAIDTTPSFLPMEFDRVGFLLSNSQDADQARFSDINITKANIQTLILDVNTNTGAMSIRNSSGADFDMMYYEVTSANGNLDHVADPSGWVSFDDGEGGDPVGAGWDEIGFSSASAIGEMNLEDSLLIPGSGTSLSLGNAFNAATATENRDLSFYFALADGSVMRGIVNYNTTSSLLSIPEPCTFELLALLGISGLGVRRGKGE